MYVAAAGKTTAIGAYSTYLRHLIRGALYSSMLGRGVSSIFTGRGSGVPGVSEGRQSSEKNIGHVYKMCSF